MAKLEGLIRVQKHAVDEKQKILARLYKEQEDQETAKQKILNQVQQETKASEAMENDPFLQSSFGNFLESAKQQIHKIDEDLDRINMRIELAQEKIKEAFEELKKTEIIDQSRKDKEKKARLKKENAELDDIGIEGHRRQQKK